VKQSSRIGYATGVGDHERNTTMRSILAAATAAGLTALALLAGSGAAGAQQQAPVPAADHGGGVSIRTATGCRSTA
jgi:hypothetical protein